MFNWAPRSLLLASLAGLLFCAQSATAAMCGTSAYSADKLIAHFQKQAAAKEPNAAEILRLLHFGRDAIGISEYRLCPQRTFEDTVKDLNEWRIKSTWLSFIGQKSAWANPLPSSAQEKLKSEKQFLMKFFGEKSFGFAWVLQMTGDQVAAKALLQKVFNSEADSAMKMREWSRSFGDASSELQQIYDALASVSTADELKAYEKRLKKVKVHLSSLPNSLLMT